MSKIPGYLRAFDPYKEDKDRSAQERAEWIKKNRRGFGAHDPQTNMFAGLKRRKLRPVTLPTINLPDGGDDDQS